MHNMSYVDIVDYVVSPLLGLQYLVQHKHDRVKILYMSYYFLFTTMSCIITVLCRLLYHIYNIKFKCISTVLSINHISGIRNSRVRRSFWLVDKKPHILAAVLQVLTCLLNTGVLKIK